MTKSEQYFFSFGYLGWDRCILFLIKWLRIQLFLLGVGERGVDGGWGLGVCEIFFDKESKSEKNGPGVGAGGGGSEFFDKLTKIPNLEKKIGGRGRGWGSCGRRGVLGGNDHTFTHISNGTSTVLREHLCKIILKAMNKCRSYSPDNLKL